MAILLLSVCNIIQYYSLILQAFRLVAINDLLEAGSINDITVNFLTSFLNETNRFHVAVCLFNK